MNLALQVSEPKKYPWEKPQTLNTLSSPMLRLNSVRGLMVPFCRMATG
jgi:hypothetical protein